MTSTQSSPTHKSALLLLGAISRMRWLAGALALAGLVGLVRELHADAPPGRYTFQGVSPSDTVTDTSTGLVWQRTLSASSYSWADAATYCASLGPPWRVPSLTELQTLIDDANLAPAIDTAAFPGTPGTQFWTSSAAASSAGSAWYVYFDSGSSAFDPIGTTYRVRCVQ